MSELRGYAPPYTPSGRSGVIPPPPWHYSGDLLTVEYRTAPANVRALLPDDLELAPDDPGADIVWPASLQAPRTIFVETSDGLWQAHVPSGSCGAYLPRVVDALSKIVILL
ncbi:MAG: hypothetical protein F2842_06695 [Actinobacteria bacterium]|nr:hypothetical protein [Actinomycetota bacterium]